MKNRRTCIKLLLLTMISCFFVVSCAPSETEIKLSVISSLERIHPYKLVFGDCRAIIKAARNEYESFQVVAGALTKNIQVVNAEISYLEGDKRVIKKENFTLFHPEYMRIKNSSPRAMLPPGLYTDPLIPFKNPQTGETIKPFRTYQKYWPGPQITEGFETYPLPFEVWKKQNQPIWVDLYVPVDASAGKYNGTLTITLNNYPTPTGLTPDTLISKTVMLPIELTVWNFTLPDGPTHRNYFGGVGGINTLYNVERGSEKYDEIEMNYCQMFTDYRLNLSLPRSLMPEMNSDGSLKISSEKHQKLKNFIVDFHVTDFEIPRAEIAGINNSHRALRHEEKKKLLDYYRDFYRYLANNGWNERVYVYLYDELNTAECYNRVLELSNIVREATPQLKVLVVEQPYSQNPRWPNIDPAVDIWCGLLGFIDRGSTQAALDRGDEIWSYTTLCQRAPQYHPEYEKVKNYAPSYWQIDMPLASFRIPTWINYQYNISGLLYWALTYNKNDSWDPTFRLRFNGDGYFMYPGAPCGKDGPISSIRLKNLRESMEDYEYFCLYEKLAGREAVLDVVSKVAPEWWSTASDPQAILSVRKIIQ